MMSLFSNICLLFCLTIYIFIALILWIRFRLTICICVSYHTALSWWLYQLPFQALTDWGRQVISGLKIPSIPRIQYDPYLYFCFNSKIQIPAIPRNQEDHPFRRRQRGHQNATYFRKMTGDFTIALFTDFQYILKLTISQYFCFSYFHTKQMLTPTPSSTPHSWIVLHLIRHIERWAGDGER